MTYQVSYQVMPQAVSYQIQVMSHVISQVVLKLVQVMSNVMYQVARYLVEAVPKESVILIDLPSSVVPSASDAQSSEVTVSYQLAYQECINSVC